MMSLLVLAGALVLVLVVLPAFGHRQALRRWEAGRTVRVEVGAHGVRRELADGRHEEVRWDEVVEVDVVLARRGPHSESGGVAVLFGDAKRGVLVPLDQLESSGLAEGLTRLPGFRMEQLTEALSQEAPARTTCWARPEV